MAQAEIARWPEHVAGQRALVVRAAALILAGEVVAFPTDTVYGIGAHVGNEEAVARLFAIKERPAHKAIALLLSEPAQLATVSDYRSRALDLLACRFWPGGLTIVVPWREEVRPRSALAAVGVRVPDHPIPRALIAEVGAPVATTSANLSGAPSPVTAGDVARQIGDRIALIVDGGPCPGGRDSTVVDLATDPPVVRRVGAVPVEELEALLGPLRVET